MKLKVLCIEDDPTTQAVVKGALRDFDVIPAHSLTEAEQLMKTEDFCALVMDIQLPDGDGLRFLTQITTLEKWRKVPVLILSSHKEISNKVMAFSFGAEDFLEKPFDPIELNARVSAKVKKKMTEANEFQTRVLGDLTLDFVRQKAFITDGKIERDLRLTSVELKLLSLLTKRLEQVYSRNQIMDLVWGETFISDRTVDSHVAHLRQKLNSSHLKIETAKNFGYRAVLTK